MKLIKAMATVAGLTGLSRIAGFIRDILTAAILGAGPVADAFFVALKLPNFFRRVTAEGAFSVSFVPLYAEALEKEGRETADYFSLNIFYIMFFGLGAVSFLAFAFMPWIISAIAPGFEAGGGRYEMATAFSRITFPYLLLMSLAALIGGVMNAHNRFGPFAVAPVLFNLSLIAALLLAGYFESAGAAMSYGVLVAGFLQFGLLYITARRWIGWRLRIVKPHFTPKVKKLFRLMGPGVLGAGVVQVNLFADMIIASFLPTGSISYLYYADRLNQLPLSTVGIAVGTALLPMLSKAVAAEDKEEAGALFNRSLEITLLLGLPAAAALFILAEPIISVLFERGAFSADAAAASALCLRAYVIGLPAYIAVKVFSTAFWSQQDTMSPVKVSIVVTLSNIVLALILVQFIGVVGIALSTGLVGWLYVVLLARPLKGQVEYDARFKRALPRVVLSTAVMAATLMLTHEYILHDAIKGGESGNLLVQVGGLAGLVLAGLISYGAAIVLSGAVDIKELKIEK